MKTRTDLLKAAEQCICHDRQDAYGNPENNFLTIADFWSTYLTSKLNKRIVIEAKDVALMMCLLKIAREASGAGKEDNFIDLIGYAALGGEMSNNESTWIEITKEGN